MLLETATVRAGGLHVASGMPYDYQLVFPIDVEVKAEGVLLAPPLDVGGDVDGSAAVAPLAHLHQIGARPGGAALAEGELVTRTALELVCDPALAIVVLEQESVERRRGATDDISLLGEVAVV